MAHMPATPGHPGSIRSRQVKATMAAAAALFCGIFVLLGVQMALGEDPAIGSGREAVKSAPQKAQGTGEPIVPPAYSQQPSQPGYAEPQYYGQPYQGGGYDQAPQGYDGGQDYQQPGQYQQPQQQSVPPVQSGAS